MTALVASMMKRFQGAMVAAWLVLLVAAGTTAWAYFAVRKSVTENDARRLRAETPVFLNAIQSGFERYYVPNNTLTSLRVQNRPLIMADDEWKHRLPNLLECGFAERVLRADGTESYIVQTEIVRGETRARAKDADLALDAGMLEAIHHAVEQGTPFATPERAYDDGSGRRAIFLFSPAYGEKFRPATAERRREEVAGVAFTALDPYGFFEEVAGRKDGLVVARLVAVRTTPGKEYSATGFPGCMWEFHLEPTEKFYAASEWDHRLPNLVLGAGGVMTLLLFGIARAQAHRSITLERRVAERTGELLEANAHLERFAALKTQFVSTVSHEFRTPLGVILSSAEILDSYDGRLPHEKRRGILAEIITSTRWMESLLENVLQLGRMESGKMACTRRPLDLAGLCSRIVDEIRSCTHQRCEISFITDFAGGLASADENLLRPILSNLLTNAVKYSPAGARVQFTVSRADGSAIFTVQDEGIGIPPEDQAHLFEGFHRGGNIGLVPGTGIGLVIVKRCVELHGGTITVESSPGSGTRATVVLPLFDDAGTPAAAATS